MLKLPTPAPSISNIVGSTSIGENHNTLPRGNKLAQRKLQRKLSDPEMRTNISVSGANDSEVSAWDVPISNNRNVPAGGGHLTSARRDSDDSTSSGTNVTLATSLNVTSSFLQHSPTHEGLMNRSMDRDRTHDALGSHSKWKIEDRSFDHQAIKRNFLQPGLALINPFDPTQTTKKVTSNRRRWTHIFPKGGLEGQNQGKMQHIDERGLDMHQYRTEVNSGVLQHIAGDRWSAGHDPQSSVHSDGRIRRGKYHKTKVLCEGGVHKFF